MRSSTRLIMFAVLLSVCAGGVFAQRNPGMVDQQRDAEKESYFASFLDCKRVPLPDSQRRAYEAAVEYLKRFEGDRDPDAKTVRAFVTEYERAAGYSQIFSAYSSKNYAKVFELGRTALKREPKDFFVLSMMTQAGIDTAQPGDASLNETTLGYAREAIQQMEGGKVANPDPFKNMETARGYLNAAVGTLLRDKSPAEAAQAFRKAVLSESWYRGDPITYHRLGVAILRGEFTQLSKEYNDKYLNQPSSADQQAMLGRINKLVEQAIDAYARAVALADPALRPANLDEPGARPQFSPDLKFRILEQLTPLYKSSYNNSDAGLKELVVSVLSKPLP